MGKHEVIRPPFTPETLAERWGCSGETVRQMVRSGQLPGFRVGRMIRISVIAVEEHEKCQSIELDAYEAVSVSHGTMPTEDEEDTGLRRRPIRKPKLKLDRSFIRRNPSAR